MSEYKGLSQLVFRNCLSTSPESRQLEKLLNYANGAKTEINELMFSLVEQQAKIDKLEKVVELAKLIDADMWEYVWEDETKRDLKKAIAELKDK